MQPKPTPAGIMKSLLVRKEGKDGDASRFLKQCCRIAGLVDMLFSTEREAMFDCRLIKTERKDGVHELTGEPLDSPAAQKPFCDAGVDNRTKLQALYFGQCVHSVILSTPLLTYLSNDREIRVCEYNISVSPKVPTMATGTQRKNSDPVHSVLFIASSFLTATETASKPFQDPGIILDPSARQMGFEETVSCAACYFSAKHDFDKRDRDTSEPLGFHYNRFRKSFLRSPHSFQGEAHTFSQELSIRVVCNVMYDEIERMGGPTVVMSLQLIRWDRFFETLKRRLQLELKQLRIRLDDIEFAGLCCEDVEHGRKELLHDYDKDGYRIMIALVSDLDS